MRFDPTQLGVVDAAALAVIAIFFLVGLVRGFVTQLVRLAALAAGLVLGRMFADPLAERLLQQFESLDPAVARIVAWTSILMVVLLISALLQRVFRSALGALRLESYDRLFGALLGALKGAALVVLAVLALSTIDGAPEFSGTLSKSQSARLTGIVVHRLDVLFPRELDARYSRWLERESAAAPAQH